MKESIRRSESSDETNSSQETTSTSVSESESVILNDDNNTNIGDRDRSLVFFDLKSIHENDETDNHKYYSLSNDSDANNTGIKDETFKTTVVLPADNQTETSTVSGQQHFTRPRGVPVNRFGIGHISGELEPLLEQENANSACSIYTLPVSQDSKDTSGYAEPLSHSKTYPQELNYITGNQAGICGRTNLPKPANDCKETEKSLKEIQDKSKDLKETYRKLRTIALILVVCDFILIVCVITLTSVGVIPRKQPELINTSALAPSINDRDASYNVCFDCADLERDRDFTANSLRGLYQKDGSCCFDSISSVYLSFKQIFQSQMEDRSKTLSDSLSYMKSLSLEVLGEKQNLSTENIIERILSLNAPKQKTVVHLLSAEGMPEKVVTMSGVFYKVRWNPKDGEGDKRIIRGKASVWDGLNIQVHSEGYYFLYTRLHFQAKPGYRDVTINYNINRQRGSTSRYINEAKESCIGSSLEHNGIAEMVVHLNRYDKIFVSVSQSDIQFLSTHVGAHMIGLFEL